MMKHWLVVSMILGGALVGGSAVAQNPQNPQRNQDPPKKTTEQTAAQGDAKAVKIPFDLKQGQTWKFRVKLERESENIGDAGGQTGEKTEDAVAKAKERTAQWGNVTMQYGVRVSQVVADGFELNVAVERVTDTDDGTGLVPTAGQPPEEKLDPLFFKVNVDKQGCIRSFEASPSSEKPAGDAGTPDKTAKTLVSEEQARGYLEAILGCGLHNQTFDQGKLYDFQPGTEGTKPTAAKGAADLKGMIKNEGLQLRFVGIVDRENKKIARFLLVPEGAPESSGPTGGADANKKPGEAGSGKPGDTSLADDRLGRILYSTTDGLLEELHYRPKIEGAITSPIIAIRRV